MIFDRVFVDRFVVYLKIGMSFLPYIFFPSRGVEETPREVSSSPLVPSVSAALG